MLHDPSDALGPDSSQRTDLAASADASLPSAFSESLHSLGELDHAIEGHFAWLRGICRVVLQGAPPVPEELAEDAHHRCTFGRWYHGCLQEPLRQHAIFAELGSHHHQLHEEASRLLAATPAGASVDPELLMRFLDRVVAFNGNARRLHSEVITDLALRDPLTGAFNRHSMRQHLEAEWARFERLGQPCALAIVDLDHFKAVNDHFGHAVGDTALRQLADRIGRQLRRYDRLFRVGGEEFLVCLPGTSSDALPLALERLRRIAQAVELSSPEGAPVRLTVSIGAARFAQGSDIEDSLRRADAALYTAKRKGRNRVAIDPV